MKKRQNKQSLNDFYEMESNNYSDYTTDNFDNLEFAEDIDFKDKNKDYIGEIRIPLNKKKTKRH